MIYLKHYAGGLYLDNGRAVLLVHSAAELKAALQRFRNETAMITQGDTPMGPRQTPAPPPTAGRRMGHTEELPDPRVPLPDPAARNLKPISAQQAEQEPPRDRVFGPSYPAKTYTVHATSPHGYACELAFTDMAIESFEKILSQLASRGWTI